MMGDPATNQVRLETSCSAQAGAPSVVAYTISQHQALARVRERLVAKVEKLINMLDLIDGDPDLELDADWELDDEKF